MDRLGRGFDVRPGNANINVDRALRRGRHVVGGQPLRGGVHGLVGLRRRGRQLLLGSQFLFDLGYLRGNLCLILSALLGGQLDLPHLGRGNGGF